MYMSLFSKLVYEYITDVVSNQQCVYIMKLNMYIIITRV